MTRALLLAMLLQGCAAFSGKTCPEHGSSTPPVSEAVLRDTWGHDFGALPATCPHWTWNVWTPDWQDRYCLTSRYAGCTIWYDGCPMTITTQAYAGDPLLAAHEYAHYALRCSGKDSDPQHSNPAVWGAGGFVHSFER